MASVDSELTILSDFGLKWEPILFKVAANADQTKILHAKVERTIQMNLFLPSTVCHAREVKQHMRRRETHERYAVFEWII